MRTGVSILLYHRVGPRDGSSMDRYTVSPGRFAAQMTQIHASGLRGIAIDDLVGRVRPSGNTVVITFDDGFACNREHAWPVLERHGFRATTFLVAGRLGGVNAWDGEEMARYRLLDLPDLRAASPSCMTFQSHGFTHANLAEVPYDACVREISGSKDALAVALGRSIEAFAYPFGVWNRKLRDAVARAGYRAACTCEGGRNAPNADPFLLRRVEVLDEDIGWRLAVKLRTGWHPERLLQPRTWRGVLASSLRKP